MMSAHILQVCSVDCSPLEPNRAVSAGTDRCIKVAYQPRCCILRRPQVDALPSFCVFTHALPVRSAANGAFLSHLAVSRPLLPGTVTLAWVPNADE